VALTVAVLVAAGGLGVIAAALLTAPVPPAADAAGDPLSSGRGGAEARIRSTPTRIRAAAIRLDAPLLPVGVATDGTVQVPPLSRPMLAGWYRNGPSPGERGSAVLVGHVDTVRAGPAVFYNLGRLRPGATVDIVRRDGSVATFRVDAVRSYPKKAFPSALVYGPTPRPSLRLVTCGGRYDRKHRNYLDNVVVFASLVAWH